MASNRILADREGKIPVFWRTEKGKFPYFGGLESSPDIGAQWLLGGVRERTL